MSMHACMHLYVPVDIPVPPSLFRRTRARPHPTHPPTAPHSPTILFLPPFQVSKELCTDTVLVESWVEGATIASVFSDIERGEDESTWASAKAL
jgi:hypothetical protein